jgi:uroporphyrinogen III methyltransferase/synthase
MSHASRAPGSARPLSGRRIVVTRAREQASELARELEALGATVVCAPAIRIEALRDLEPLRRALAHLAEYRWVVFTSPNTVRVVFERLAAWGHVPGDFTRTRVAAIGPATAEALARHGVTAHLVPAQYVAEAVVAALAAEGDLAKARILLPRAESARDVLPDGLRARGAHVDVIPVYRTIPDLEDGAGLAQDILEGRVDVVTLTSSSTVHAFVRAVGREAARSDRYRAAVIGPVTATTAREYGLPVAIEASEFTAGGLVNAMVRYYEQVGRGTEGG